MSQKYRSNTEVLTFIIILSFISALILASLASALEEPKEVAKDLDKSKQMMIAARILTHQGTFLVEEKDGTYKPANYSGNGLLEVAKEPKTATKKEILDVFKYRLKPMLVDPEGKLSTFEKLGINEAQYLSDNKKSGYYKAKNKLIYTILPNVKDAASQKPVGYIIPVNGYGLWDAIYGYLAIKPDGNTVIGISWYDQKETPGLGANIADAPWQSLFPGKKIFQEGPSGKADFKTSPVGIIVVKGKVSETLGDVPKAKSAVDGMAGATLTGNGVTDAYRDVLNAYRPFFINLNGNKG